MKNILTVLAIAILISGSAHASAVDSFKKGIPDVSRPTEPPVSVPTGPTVIMGSMPVACMKTTGVVANYLERGFKMQELGTNKNGIFERWSGVYEGKKRWSIVMRSERTGLTCKIAGGDETKEKK